MKQIINYNDERVKTKVEWLNDTYINEGTIKRMLSNYKNMIYPAEQELGKDVKDFTHDEILDILQEKKLYPTTIKNTVSLIRSYYKWCREQGLAVVVEDIDASDVLKEVPPVIVNVDDIEYLMDKVTYQGIDIDESIILMLMRYGVIGSNYKWLIEARYEWIDRDNLLINIVEGNKVVTRLPIDYHFLDAIDRTSRSKGRILLNMDRMKGSPLTYNTIISRMHKIQKACIKLGIEFNSSIRDYLISRELDFMLKIRSTGLLRVKDITNIAELFNMGRFNVTALTELWKRLAPDDFMIKVGHGETTILKNTTQNNKEFVYELMAENDIDVILADVPTVSKMFINILKKC